MQWDSYFPNKNTLLVVSNMNFIVHDILGIIHQPLTNSIIFPPSRYVVWVALEMEVPWIGSWLKSGGRVGLYKVVPNSELFVS
jgi:hypothetical protein